MPEATKRIPCKLCSATVLVPKASEAKYGYCPTCGKRLETRCRELADLREAAFGVERFALPYWGDDSEPKAIPVSNEAIRRLQAALYPEDNR